MNSVTKNFSAVGISTGLYIRKGESFTYDIAGTFVGKAYVVRTVDGGQTQQRLSSALTTVTSGTLVAEENCQVMIRCTEYTSGTLESTLTESADVLGQVPLPSGAPLVEYLEDGVKVYGNLQATGNATVAGALNLNGIQILVNAGVPDVTVGADTAAKGSLCIDSTNGNLYINQGTAGTPSWALIALD